MARELRLVITNAGENDELGREYSFPLSEPVLVGRSHKCGVRFNEADVSGQHLRFSASDGSVLMEVLSDKSTVMNEKSYLTKGDIRAVANGDTFLLGKRTRFRIDSIGKEASRTAAGKVAMHPDEDGETQAMTLGGMTAATRIVSAEVTEETRIGQDNATVATRAANTQVTFSSRVVSAEATASSVGAEVIEATPTPLDAARDPVNDNKQHRSGHPIHSETTDGIEETATFPVGMSTGTDTQNEPGTDILRTQIIDRSEVERMKDLGRKNERYRHFFTMIAAAFFSCVLGAVVWLCRPKSETWLSVPKMSDGRIDVSYYTLKTGGKDVCVVDFPNDPRLKKTEQPDGRGFYVLTYTGRDRDVPFRLELTQQSSNAELHRSLEESAEQVKKTRLSENASLVFQSPYDWPAGSYFFEDEYPGSCHPPRLLRGSRFWRSEYDVVRSGVKWHGVLFVFRDGVTVYTLQREIPTAEWARGRLLLRIDPNIEFYPKFLEERWESPGESSEDAGLLPVPKNERPDDFIARIAKEVSDELKDEGRVSEWGRVKRKIDTLMALTWKGDSGERKRAVTLLEKFRQNQDRKYVEFRNEFDLSKKNENKGCRKMKSVSGKCKAVFGKDPTDRRFNLSNDLENWSCQEKR